MTVLRLVRSSWQRPGSLQNNDNQAVYPGKAHFTTAEMYYRAVTKPSPECKGWERDTPVSWSLPFARCFILPIASFVIGVKTVRLFSLKSQMSQRYRIIASSFHQCGQGPLAVAMLHDSRVLFKWKVNKFPNVGLIKSKEMIKFKPGWALNRSYFSHRFL